MSLLSGSMRGKLGGLFQFNIVLGMVVSQFVNWGIGAAAKGFAPRIEPPLALASLGGYALPGENAWRWMLGAEAVPALVFTLMTLFLSESPRYLAMRENGRAACPHAAAHAYAAEPQLFSDARFASPPPSWTEMAKDPSVGRESYAVSVWGALEEYDWVDLVEKRNIAK